MRLWLVISFFILISLSCEASVVTPIPVNTFINTIGINTHLGQYNYTIPSTETEMAYLGINKVRDQVTIDALPLYLQMYNETGIKLSESVNPTSGNYSAILSFITTNRQIFTFIENPNEPDGSFPITWNGQSGTPATIAFAYQLAKDIPAICLQLLGPSLGFPSNGGPLPANYNNDHIYMQYLYPSSVTGSTLYPSNIAFLSSTVPGKAPVITETGGWTSPAAAGWTENVQAKYNLNAYFDAYICGSTVQNDLYELNDQVCDPSGTDREKHFGQFHCDFTPKVSATTIHNTTTILADTGIKTPTSLSYTISGSPTGGGQLQQLLMQKSNGSWWLAVWNDVGIWDFVNFQEVTVATTSTVINLGITASTINVYDPYLGTTVQQTASNTNTITVAIPDHVIFVQVSP